MNRILITSVHPFSDGRIIKHAQTCKEIFEDVSYMRFNIAERGNRSRYFDGVDYTEIDFSNYSKIMQYLAYFIAGFGKGFIPKSIMDKHYDIAHAHDPQSLLVASLLKSRKGFKLVYDRHEKWDAPFYAKHNRYIEKCASRNIDALICVTNEMKETLPTYLNNCPHAIVPNWPSKKMFSKKKFKRKLLNLKNARTMKIVYFGFLSEERTKEMFELFKMLDKIDKNTEILIGGQGPSASEAEMLASKHRTIKYLGHVSYEEVVKHTEEAHFGMMFTDTKKNIKTSNNKLNEYLLAGVIPIVKINEDDYSPEWPINLMNNWRTSDILKYIISLWSDKSTMKKLMCEIFEFGQNRTWEKAAKEYQKVYKNVLNNLDT